MSDKHKPPTIVTAVCFTIMGLFALAGCFFMTKSGGPDFLVLTSILLNVMLIALAVAGGAAALAVLVQIFRQGGWKLAEPSIIKSR